MSENPETPEVESLPADHAQRVAGATNLAIKLGVEGNIVLDFGTFVFNVPAQSVAEFSDDVAVARKACDWFKEHGDYKGFIEAHPQNFKKS